jgi:cytochrome c55X
MTGNGRHEWTRLALAALLMLPLAAPADIAPQRQQALRHLLRQDCGSCHGLTLQGGLGPALTRAALAGKSPEMLRSVILHGRPGTPMPPWRPFLSEAEATWLVQQLQAGVPDEKQ